MKVVSRLTWHSLVMSNVHLCELLHASVSASLPGPSVTKSVTFTNNLNCGGSVCLHTSLHNALLLSFFSFFSLSLFLVHSSVSPSVSLLLRRFPRPPLNSQQASWGLRRSHLNLRSSGLDFSLSFWLTSVKHCKTSVGHLHQFQLAIRVKRGFLLLLLSLERWLVKLPQPRQWKGATFQKSASSQGGHHQQATLELASSHLSQSNAPAFHTSPVHLFLSALPFVSQLLLTHRDAIMRFSATQGAHCYSFVWIKSYLHTWIPLFTVRPVDQDADWIIIGSSSSSRRRRRRGILFIFVSILTYSWTAICSLERSYPLIYCNVDPSKSQK